MAPLLLQAGSDLISKLVCTASKAQMRVEICKLRLLSLLVWSIYKATWVWGSAVPCDLPSHQRWHDLHSHWGRCACIIVGHCNYSMIDIICPLTHTCFEDLSTKIDSIDTRWALRLRIVIQNVPKSYHPEHQQLAQRSPKFLSRFRSQLVVTAEEQKQQQQWLVASKHDSQQRQSKAIGRLKEVWAISQLSSLYNTT